MCYTGICETILHLERVLIRSYVLSQVLRTQGFSPGSQGSNYNTHKTQRDLLVSVLVIHILGVCKIRQRGEIENTKGIYVET